MADTDYTLLAAQIDAVLENEPDALANACNIVGVLFDALDDVNWLGLYVLRGDELVLGPFQGKPACVRIPVGRGVCGTAAATRETQRVADVHSFAGHIVCDERSRSELVVPLLFDDELVGVLDMDSPTPSRFSAADQSGIEAIVAAYSNSQAGRGFI